MSLDMELGQLSEILRGEGKPATASWLRELSIRVAVLERAVAGQFAGVTVPPSLPDDHRLHVIVTAGDVRRIKAAQEIRR